MIALPFSFRFLRKYKPLFSFCVNLPFCYGNTNINCFHSQTQFKQNKPIKKFDRKIKKTKIKDKLVTSKVYMKDTIKNISNILGFSTWDSVQEQLIALDIKWDSYTVNQVLKTHPPMEKAWLFFNWASRLKNFKHDQFTYTTMMDIFGEAKRISSMKFVYKQMQEKGIKIDVVTYTSMMHWLSNDGDVDGSVKIWEEMKDEGFDPTVVSYTAYMKILFDHGRVKDATKVYKEMIKSGCPPNCFTYTVLMEHLASSGKFIEVLEIFIKMQEAGVQPDKATCNILVDKCCIAGETQILMKILQYMKENSLVLRQSVYAKALETLRNAKKSDALLNETNRHLSTHFKKDEPTDGTISDINSIDQYLMLNLLGRKHFVAVDFLLKDMIEKNVLLTSEIVSSVIETYSTHNSPNGALLAYDYSTKLGINVEKSVYLFLLGLLIRTNSFTKVVEIVEEMVKDGIFMGISQSSLIIYKLGCAKKPLCAAKVFNLLPDNQKSTTAYTALMAAYFASRNALKGLQTFKAMKEERVPIALGTYNVLLDGLEKSDRVCELEVYRKEKKRLQSESFSESSESVEVKTCNLLFARDFVA